MTPSSPGWYDDPHQSDQLRYFDGIVWTAHVAPRRTREATAPPQDGTGASAAGPAVPAPPTADPYGWRGPGGPIQPPTGQQWGQPMPGPQQWQQPPATGSGPRTADGVALASYWQRVGASVLDTLITGVLSTVLGGWLLWKAIGPWFQQLVDAAAAGDSAKVNDLSQNYADHLVGSYFLAFVLVTAVVQLLYHMYFLTRSGATPGKRAAGISVRLAARPGALSADTALRRQLIAFGTALLGMVPGGLSAMGSLLTLADVLLPLWDPKRQALHDKLAGTQVVRGPQPPRS